MNNFEKRILRGVKDNIAISNLEEEYMMKKISAKKVTLMTVVGILCVFGSFMTVNAATGGKLLDNITTVVYRVYNGGLWSDVSVEGEVVKVDTSAIMNESGEITEGTYKMEVNDDGSISVKTKTGPVTLQEIDEDTSSVTFKEVEGFIY